MTIERSTTDDTKPHHLYPWLDESAGDRGRWKFDDDHVRWAMAIVDDMGVLEQIARWRVDGRRGPGGPKDRFPIRTLLVAIVLCAREGLPLLGTVVRDVLYKNISAEMRHELEVSDPPRRRDVPKWMALENVVRHRFQQMLGVMDPSPLPKNRRLEPADFVARTRSLSPAQQEELYTRLSWFANQVLDVSVRQLRPEILAKWEGAAAIDATHLPLFARGERRPGGRKFPVTRHSSDPDGGWYYREGDHSDGTGEPE
jgi:hypothetical protein